MSTTVTLLLKGSVVLFAKEGQSMGSVRILKSPPPNHVLTLAYQKQPPNSAFEKPIPITPIEDNLTLTVNNPKVPNITLRDRDAKINRKKSPKNQDSFKWFVDLENGELYDGPIGVKKSAFRQVLKFNSGQLFNDITGDPDNPSYNFLLIQKGNEANYQDFGYVSIRIGIEFVADGSVVFNNGTGPDPVFDSSKDAAGTNYRIILVNDMDPNLHPALVTDANHYYKALGSMIPPEDRILFASIKQRKALESMATQARLRKNDQFADEVDKLSGPAGPEACCFPTYVSRSDP
jgi:hypothetical protein